ncbi:MAG: hypothetical protein ABJ205_12910 [Erythrobacter sp.]|uniref:glycosyltransferase family 39 protein n=1 Tax=Erythrobacter sp. TaxID=1042 RepID=UPI00326460AB
MSDAFTLKVREPWPKGLHVLNTAQARSFAVALLVVAVTVLIRSPYFGDPAADPDEQLYSLIGQAWLEGEMPYRDLWDRKPPGLFAMFAGMHWIGGPSPLAYQIPGVACTAASALMIYHLAKRIGTPTGAAVVTVLFLLNIPRFFMHLGQSETFLVPILLLQLIGIASVLRNSDPAKVFRTLCGIMLLGGIALQIKYSVLPFCALLAVLATFRLWQMQLSFAQISASLCVFAFLGLLPTLIFAAYFASVGEFETFFFANFVSIFLRTEMYPRLVGYNLINLATVIFPLAVYAVLSVITARKMREQIDGTLFVLTLLFALVGAFSLFMLGSPFVHYFGVTLPFICLAASSFFSFHPSRKIFNFLALALALWCTGFAEQRVHSSSHKNAIATLTKAIGTYVPDDECIFIFDGPSILYSKSQRCIPTRYAFTPHLNSFHEQTALDVDPAAETARILAGQPGVIVVSETFNAPRYVSETRAMVRDAITKGYVLAERTEFYPGMLELYLRADLAPADRDGIDRPASVPCVIKHGNQCQYFASFTN